MFFKIVFTWVFLHYIGCLRINHFISFIPLLSQLIPTVNYKLAAFAIYGVVFINFWLLITNIVKKYCALESEIYCTLQEFYISNDSVFSTVLEWHSGDETDHLWGQSFRVVLGGCCWFHQVVIDRSWRLVDDALALRFFLCMRFVDKKIEGCLEILRIAVFISLITLTPIR